MIRKILIYEDALSEEHPALERGVWLTNHNGGELKVVDVVPGQKDFLREIHRPMRSLIEQERKDRLDEICRPLRQRDTFGGTELIRGRPFVEIIREVVHAGFQMVIKTMDPANEGIGPVDFRLVRNCPCPVWLEPRTRAQRTKNIVVAIDPCDSQEELNFKLVQLGGSLRKIARAKLHLVSAYRVPEEHLLKNLLQHDNLTRYKRDIRNLGSANIERLLDRCAKDVGEGVVVHLDDGPPSDVILSVVDKVQPDVLIMGSVGKCDVHGLLIGNTADSVLRQVNVPVVALKPDALFRV